MINLSFINKYKIFSIIAFTFSCGLVYANQCEKPQLHISNPASGEKLSKSNTYDARMYKQFELTEKDWDTFQIIKKGPLGYKNPDIEPLLALAMFAKSKAEEERFLALFAKQQKYIWDRGKYIEKKYSEVYKRLYPGEMPIDQSKIYTDPDAVHPKDRFILAVNRSCGECIDEAQSFISTSAVFPRNGIDIYVQDAKSEKEVVEWAKRVIPISELEQRDITINMPSNDIKNILSDSDISIVVRRDDRIIAINSLELMLGRK